MLNIIFSALGLFAVMILVMASRQIWPDSPPPLMRLLQATLGVALLVAPVWQFKHPEWAGHDAIALGSLLFLLATGTLCILGIWLLAADFPKKSSNYRPYADFMVANLVAWAIYFTFFG